MNDNEKLIEEARDLVASWDRRGSWDADSPVGMVMRLADALEAVEKARATADDEREAQARIDEALDYIDRHWLAPFRPGETAHDLRSILAVGSRRSEVPEPSAEQRIGCNLCGEALPDGEPHICSHPQGEPSDAQVRETLVAAMADAMGVNGEFSTSALSDVSNVVELELVDDSCQLNVYRDSGVGDGFSIDLGRIADAVIALHAYRTVHGGYSAAEDIEGRVDAALSTYKGYYRDHEGPGDPSRNAMRAALRAASAVTEQGEKRG